MIKNTGPIIFVLFMTFFISAAQSSQQADSWKQWLKDVEPIISKAEEQVFESLMTEEDRVRFINSFWKTRDPDPQTPQNEFKLDYYQRLSFANSRFRGIRSDRGRILMILGEPLERNTYSGAEQLVECELWSYHIEGRPGLPPFFNLLFFKKRDTGDFELYYPGMHKTKDILSPGYQSGRTSEYQAYREISGSFSELAHATLSVIPGEGSPNFPASASSNQVFAQIFSLPEKEAAGNYLRSFRSIEGTVDVLPSYDEIQGFAQISIGENRGLKFLNYSIMPDVLHTRKAAENLHSADLQFTLRIADPEGRTVYQKERQIEFRMTDLEHKGIQVQKAVFSDFLPIIPGDFTVSIVFQNKTTEEFFSYEEKIKITDQTVPVLVGYEAEESSSDTFMPFSTDRHKMFSDPRLVFNKTDSLVGLVFTEKKPSIDLVRFEDESDSIEIKEITQQGGYFVFKQTMEDLKASYYRLVVKQAGARIYEKIIGVLPRVVKKPRAFEWSDPLSAANSYKFEMAQQHLNAGELETAIDRFNELPSEFWNVRTLPIIARAYYRNRDYAKVVELLEGETVTKDYSILLLLGNSCLEIKQLEKAAEYFEQLRNYGDTVKINQVLGAIFLSLGEGEKAKVYFDRAKKIQNDSDIKKNRS